MLKLGYVRNKRKKPIYNESLLAGETLRPRKKKNVGDQVGKPEEETVFKQDRYNLRPDFENQVEPETHKHYTAYKSVPTGDVIPAHWLVKYEDGTTGTESAKDVQKHFGLNFMNYCINSCSKKFVSVPVGANKESSLIDWPNLILQEAPKIEYKQGKEDDLCIIKAFASVLHHVGFISEAKELNDKFNHKMYSFTNKDYNLQAIYHYLMKLLPYWLQVTRRGVKDMKWDEDIQNYDLFLGVLKGSDGQVNHAVGIFNNWIFDGNEDIAIPLSKEGLDYCVSTPKTKVEFLKFNDVFLFRENNKHQYLKRKYHFGPDDD